MRKTKRVTIKDIAELAGVSKATASLVLNGRSKELRVAEETRERVLAIAKEHHYQPSIHARSLRDNRSHTIGLVVPEITNYGFAVFSHELETLCREAGVQLLISCSDENPGQETVVVNNMVARQVDGLIVASSMLNDADYQKLSEQLPVVLFDRHMNDSTLPLVLTDSITPTATLVADIARKHPDEFYFLGGQPRLSPTRDRLEGLLRYMGQHNLLQSDMRLASFDDHYLYDSLTIPVDTVRQDNRQLAWHCFDLIGKLIEGETPEPIQRKLDATLQRRYKAVE
ncbi:TPA: LacI family DNA-binding transcriptional regulator [Enterobacter hormaechei subsp. xiangfangensis]|nr:LacI family DNA-binding transcriptional regulator [Enterobacter hormaechei subsp. xiangfangensis]